MSKHMHDNTIPILDMDKWDALTNEDKQQAFLGAEKIATDLLLLLGGRQLGRDQGKEERQYIAGELKKVRIDAEKRFGLKG